MLDLIRDFAVRERVRRFFFFILIDARLRSLFRIFFSALLNQRFEIIVGNILRLFQQVLQPGRAGAYRIRTYSFISNM